MATRLRSALVGLVLSATATTIRAAGTCYYPNGLEAEDSPCDPSADTSACCGGSQGTACLDNGLCRTGDGGLIRGSCTGKDWNNCPNDYCLGASTGGTDLISCSNVTKSSADYCCDHTNGCCDSGVGRFQVLPSNPVTLATWGGSGFVVVETSTPTPTPTTSASSSSSSTTTSEVTTTGTAGGASDSQFTSSSSSSSSSNSSSDSSGLSSGAKIGIGVGVSLGVLMLAGMGYIIWRLQRTDKLLKQGGAATAPGRGGAEAAPETSSPPPNSWAAAAPTVGISHEIDSDPHSSPPPMSEADSGGIINKGYYAPPPAELASHNFPTSELDGRVVGGRG